MKHLSLGVLICVASPKTREVQLGDDTFMVAPEWWVEKWQAADDITICGPLLYHVLLMRSRKRSYPIMLKICKYHDRFGNWPSESLIWRFVLEQSWYGRAWLGILDVVRTP